ncbi:MAG: hypothetical protein HYY95_10970 [Candidatus Rokubacteria bacterium]|nr:hypothetical protein [Candidatus Rokubacteria bacterium]
MPRLGQPLQARRGHALCPGRGLRQGPVPPLRAARAGQGPGARRPEEAPRRRRRRGEPGERGRARPRGDPGRLPRGPGPRRLRAAPRSRRAPALPHRAARLACRAAAPARRPCLLVPGHGACRSPRAALPGGGRPRSRPRPPPRRRGAAAGAATPSTELNVMHGETAAVASFSRRLVKEQEARRPLGPVIDQMNALAQQYRDQSRPIDCAIRGFVDEVVHFEELRRYLVAFTSASYRNLQSICPQHNMLLPRLIRSQVVKGQERPKKAP